MNRLAKIGLFFLIVGVGGVSYILLAVDRFDRLPTYEVTVFMDDAMGLTTNTRVSMAGVPVGTIRSIQLENGKAKLTLAIEENVDIFEDAVVSKQASSLLGTSVISIDPGSRGAASMSDGGTIHTVITRGDFGETLDSAEDAGKEMARILKEFREELMTEAATQGIAEIIENLRQTSQVTRELLEQNLRLLAGTLETIDRFADRVDRQSPDELERISTVLENAAGISDRLERIIGGGEDDLAITIAELRHSAEQLSASMDRISRVSEDVQDVSGTIRSGEGTLGRIVYDDELYTRVTAITASAESIVERIVGLETQVAFQSTYLTRAEAAQNEFALRLLPRTRDRYYELGIVNTPDDVVQRTSTTTTVDGGAETVEVQERARDEIRFNAQIARIFGPLTLRGGLIESTGGFGVDVRPFRQLELSGEMFDFGTHDRPNLRTTGTVYPFYDPAGDYPWYWLYLTGGVNNTLNADEREYFLGGGLRFTDEEIRGLIGLIPLGQ